MNIGEKIKKVLTEKNITQTELSIETKIALPKLNLILNGKRRIKLEELEVICWALNVSVNTFLTPRPPRAQTRMQEIGA